MSKEEYNKKWVELNQEIQKLNRDRFNLYIQYQKEFGGDLDWSINWDDLNKERKLVNQKKDE
tara:strand:- start:320 stop:505 length:186 start_codon:yes stop_codon:yes gene_type:complete